MSGHLNIHVSFVLDGVLIILVAVVDEDGQYHGKVNDGTQNVLALLSHLWKDMVLEGRITQACV